MSLYSRYVKRLIDIAAAVMVLLILLPVLVLIALAIRIEDGGDSFYVSQRVGKGGTLFRFIKFRSMPINTASTPSSKGRELTITRIGTFIRRTNIDEIPQLLNIVRGDMSLVGPRPCIPEQSELIELRRRSGAIKCRPGLTGLAQIKAYDDMPVEEKAQYDAEYASEITFAKDIKIIFGTLSYLRKPPPVY